MDDFLILNKYRITPIRTYKIEDKEYYYDKNLNKFMGFGKKSKYVKK